MPIAEEDDAFAALAPPAPLRVEDSTEDDDRPTEQWRLAFLANFRALRSVRLFCLLFQLGLS